MTWKLFIDDERNPVTNDWVIARSSKSAIDYTLLKGLPIEIAFDHDLGGEDTSMAYLKWLVDYMLDNNLAFQENFTFSVHSQNPIGVANIQSLLEGLITALGCTDMTSGTT